MKNTAYKFKQEAMDSLNDLVIFQQPWIKDYIDLPRLESSSYRESLDKLFLQDQGGFDHGDLSGLYVHYQNDPRYKATRLFGWKSIFEIVVPHIELQGDLKDGLIIDFLAGSGTLSKRLKQVICQKPPSVLGLDISHKMCEQGMQNGEVVLWGNHENHLFKSNKADATVAAYGFHHIPVKERSSFVLSMKNVLKEDGICLLHDFEEGSSTASWYSNIIHNYRTYGHPYQHVTREGLKSLLGTHFDDVEIKSVYDPFYLEGEKNQDETSLTREFFAYLIAFFNLQKLLPSSLKYEELKYHDDATYWQRIENIFSPCFNITDKELNYFTKDQNKFQNVEFKYKAVPLVNKLTCQPLNDGRLSLIAPRMALIGFGYKGRR